MQAYTAVYLKAFGKDETSFVKCELCKNKATEIHHILSRKKYKRFFLDKRNLMAICRVCHVEYGDEVYTMPLLLKIHRKVLELNNIDFDNRFFEYFIELYENKAKLKE